MSQLTRILFVLSTVSYVSGQSSSIGCNSPGQCLSSETVGIALTNSSIDCLETCKTTQDCAYFTVYTTDAICLLLSECAEFDSSCTDCISGEVRPARDDYERNINKNRKCSIIPFTTLCLLIVTPLGYFCKYVSFRCLFYCVHALNMGISTHVLRICHCLF